MVKKRAFLISFEGIEGTGKSTQCRLLVNYLKRKGLKVTLFREPGSSAVGEKMREILLHGKGNLTSLSETLLFIIARAQLVVEKIKPSLKKKDIIILDRYIDATLAYQGYGGNVDKALIKSLNKHAIADMVPDLTILFDIDPKIGLTRSGRGDRFEKRKISFHRRVRNGYLKVARENQSRIKVIPVKDDIQTIQQCVRDIVQDACRCRKLRKYF
ncbi:MAG: dTMP kinase [PVC group bacterium]|nr:dTMP kinase [PVC group bacterium]